MGCRSSSCSATRWESRSFRSGMTSSRPCASIG